MKYAKYVLTIVAIAAMSLGSPVRAGAADDGGNAVREGLFFGYSVGTAHHDSDDDYAWGMDALYRFSAYGALQASYMDLGKAPGQGPVDGVYFSAAPMISVPGLPITLYASAGLAVFDGDEGLGYGAGALYDLPLNVLKWAKKGFSVRLGWRHIDLQGGDANTVLAGLYYRFGKP